MNRMMYFADMYIPASELKKGFLRRKSLLIFIYTVICTMFHGSFLHAEKDEKDSADYLKFIGITGDDTLFFRSATVDFMRIRSTITDNVSIAVAVYKSAVPSRILLVSHGWHGAISRPDPGDRNPFPEFLTVMVDMRGRKFSTGKPDCNGYELYDFYDAFRYVIENYPYLISDPGQVYFFGESGGGGNGFSIVGKFPDLFCSACINCGMSDYELWFRDDEVGEFRDEMIPWIGCTPEENPEAYASRSGMTTVRNLLTPVYITHGEKDERVPSYHSRNFYQKAIMLSKKAEYLELKNVGTQEHWGNITPEQIKEKEKFMLKGLAFHPEPILPEKGTMIVAGFLVTRNFSVFLDSLDDVAQIKYNIKSKKVRLRGAGGRVVWKD